MKSVGINVSILELTLAVILGLISHQGWPQQAQSNLHGDPKGTEPSAQQSLEQMRENFKKGSSIDAATWESIPMLDVLTKIGHPAAPVVLFWFKDKSVPEGMRDVLGTEVLPKIVGSDSLPALSKVLNDPAEKLNIKAAALSAVGAITGKAAEDQLLAFAKTNIAETKMQTAIIRALATNGDRRGAPVITPYLHDPKPYLQVVAASALNSISEKNGDPSIARPVLDLLDDRHIEYRSAIVASCAYSHYREAIPNIVRLARNHDEAYGVRFAAVNALGQFGGPEALGALTTILKDNTEPNDAVKAHAALAAVQAGLSKDELPLLQRVLLSTKDAYLRGIVSKSIRTLQGKS